MKKCQNRKIIEKWQKIKIAQKTIVKLKLIEIIKSVRAIKEID